MEDVEAEFDLIDTNKGGQILFNEFIDWALSKDLDIEDDIEPEEEWKAIVIIKVLWLNNTGDKNYIN